MRKIIEVIREMRESVGTSVWTRRLADELESAMSEPVAVVVKNDSGQIRLVGKDWLAFDLSAHVGTQFYTLSPDAAAEIRDWWTESGEEKACEKELDEKDAQIERLQDALHQINLRSQNIMGSKEECGRIARAALAKEGKP
jgi:hypothetical protein